MLEKEQEEWLDRAERFKWSRNELRNRVRANRKSLEQAEGDNPKSTVDEARVNIELKVPSDHKDRWMEAASSEQQDLLSWMVAILDNAAASVPATADKPAAAD